MYIDGTEDTGIIKHRDDELSFIYENNVDLTVGYHLIDGTASRFFNGTIDNLSIYHQGLTASEVSYLFTGEQLTEDTDNGTTPALADYNHYDYGFRIYNPRIAKFLSVDPLAKEYPWNSPYAFAENDVIRSIDLDGLEKQIRINLNQNGKTTESYVILVNSRGVNAAAQKLNRALVGKDNLEANDDVSNRFNINNAFWTEGFDDYKKITYYYDNSGQFYDNTGDGELTIDIEDGYYTFSYKSELTKDAAYDEAVTKRNFGYAYDASTFFQISGDAATVTGGIISSSVIGAPVGIPLAVGGKISSAIGAGTEGFIDYLRNDYKNLAADGATALIGVVIPDFGSKTYVKDAIGASFNLLSSEAREGVRSSEDISNYDSQVLQSLGNNKTDSNLDK
ncbi:MAG: RHS repeat-associated core domain-containing protein [Bacteroidota bacterium]